MQRRAVIHLRIQVGAAVAALLLSAAPAGAAPVWSEPISDQHDLVVEDFCGVDGLDVRVVGTFSGWEGLKPKGGPGSGTYYHSQAHLDEVLTAPNGAQVRHILDIVNKDTRVVETATTIESDILATGNDVLYGANGEVIARDPGQYRFHLSIDKATGEETFTGLLRDPTGRNDDFCAATLAAFGI